MSKHRHSYSQRFESSSATCTVKLFECPCGGWRLRHYGCHGNWDSAHLERQLAEAEKLKALAEHIMALRPFAAFALHIVPDSPDDAELLPDLSVAHFRNAKASYEAAVRILFKEGE